MMQDEPNYLYDFSYSMAFDTFEGMDMSQEVEDSEKEFVEWSDILLNMRFIPDPDTYKIASLLFRLPVYRKVGLNLLNISKLVHGSSDTMTETEVQKFREELYAHRRELDRILGEDKNKYFPMIILCYFSTIQRILQEQIEITEDFAIFHTVFWELKGQVANKQTMESLISKNFNLTRFHKFMFTEKSVLEQEMSQQKLRYKKHRESTNNMGRESANHIGNNLGRGSVMGSQRPPILTFRPTVGTSNLSQSTVPNSNENMYRSFKDIANILNKENHLNNNRIPLIGNKTEKEGKPKVLNFDSFKKKQKKSELMLEYQDRKGKTNLPFGLKSPSPMNVESKPTQICFKRKNVY